MPPYRDCGHYIRVVITNNRAVRPVAILLAACCCLSAVRGQMLETTAESVAASRPDFDPDDVVRQVRSRQSASEPLHPLTTGLDDGEFLIDTSFTFTPAPSFQRSAALAFDGENFLVVWEDRRSGLYDIYGARVTPAGVVLDSAGIAISTAARNQRCPAPAFDGESFLVVWGDYRNGGSYPDIYGARVTPAGMVLDSAGNAISTAAYEQWAPVPAFDGENFLVVWEDRRSGLYDIYGARVTPAGVVLDSAGIAISTAANDQRDPALASDGGNCLVVWDDWRDDGGIYGVRVTSAGGVLDSGGFLISTNTVETYQYLPSVAFDGTDYLVVWEDRTSGSDIYGARVTPAGVVLDSTGIAISTAESYQRLPELAFDGENFLVVWGDYRNGSYTDVYGARVTPAGAVLDPSGIAISTAADHQWTPRLAFGGEHFLVAWEHYLGSSDHDIYGARVTPAGVVLDPAGIAISTAANYQWYPELAFDGENFLVVWEESRGGPYESDIYGTRVTSAGVVLDSLGIPVSTAVEYQHVPAIAFDGQNFLVAWQDQRGGGGHDDIYGARVTPAGVVLDTAGIAISTAVSYQRLPELAFDGENFLVVWEDRRSGLYDIYGARVTPAGAVHDPTGIAISTAASDQWAPALSFDGENFLVVWDDQRGGYKQHDIYGARVTPAGVVLDPAGIAISTATDDQKDPAIAFDGANFLVIWQADSIDPGICGARVTPAGVVLDSAGIAISTAAEYPALAFDGENFLAAWENYRGGSFDIYGARVTPAGAVFDSGPVVRQEGEQAYPALARGIANQMFLVYQGWTGTVRGKTYNIQRTWGKMNLGAGVEESSKAQASSHRLDATIVRDVLFLSRSLPSALSFLLSVDGRKVLDLVPGANDVRALAPGVYFVREEPQAANLKPQAVYKVILTR